MPKFTVKGKGTDTGRQRKRNYYAKNEEHARELALAIVSTKTLELCINSAVPMLN